jgi:hypothetical protein
MVVNRLGTVVLAALALPGWSRALLPERVSGLSDTAISHRKPQDPIRLEWQGDSRAIARLTFTLLDSRRRSLSEQTITSLPAEVRFTRSPDATYYRVCIEYQDGAIQCKVLPLP